MCVRSATALLICTIIFCKQRKKPLSSIYKDYLSIFINMSPTDVPIKYGPLFLGFNKDNDNNFLMLPL